MTIPPEQRMNSGPYSGQSVIAQKRDLTAQFRKAGLETADLDARLLIMAATGLSHTDIIMRADEILQTETQYLIAQYAKRRLAGEPIDHILGYREFYGREFEVNKDVLSPRPETEMLVDAALEILKDKPDARILDLGTGSGAIIISILAEAQQVQGIAVDMSAAALSVARENAKTHKVNERLSLLEGSWFGPAEGRFDIILSNPPYITDTAMGELSIEVSEFDPDLALRAGEDGLIAYHAIISEASNYLIPGGTLLFEIGYDQGRSVSQLLENHHFTSISIVKDLSGHDRMIKAAYTS
ncbi:MAG: peptide chain release factor N(5)-glutamine methyltransferase [Hellea sp.]